MLTREPYLPTRAVVAELIRKYDAVEPFTPDDLHWMVNVLHALNEDPEYQKAQDALEDEPYILGGALAADPAPMPKNEPINIAPPDDEENVS